MYHPVDQIKNRIRINSLIRGRVVESNTINRDKIRTHHQLTSEREHRNGLDKMSEQTDQTWTKLIFRLIRYLLI